MALSKGYNYDFENVCARNRIRSVLRCSQGLNMCLPVCSPSFASLPIMQEIAI